MGFRDIKITTNFMKSAYGSCLFESGNTKIICTASLEKGVPPFLKGSNKGWLTAEYAMLPASTGRRKQRDGLKKDGRGVEISRLIGRALRQAVDLARLGENTLTIDCDVLQADGGTRCASICGGFVALCLAVKRMIDEKIILESPIVRQVAAISCGIVDGEKIGDLCYEQDSKAEVDMNIVLDENENIIELQGTAEGKPFPKADFEELMDLARLGIKNIMQKQREALLEAYKLINKKQRLVIASNNEHKLAEIRAMLGKRFEVLSMSEAGVFEEIEENGESFEENARIKAEFVREKTGYLSLADDSGLCVDALLGEPGVRSARFAGEHGNTEKNNALLIQKLQGETNRKAHFVSALALASPFSETKFFRGEAEGLIIDEARGEKGFGYDPYFLFGDRTFAELSEEEKNKVSHRANAMKKLMEYLKG